MLAHSAICSASTLESFLRSLCSLRQGRCFSLSDIEWTKQWAAKLATAIEALEVLQARFNYPSCFELLHNRNFQHRINDKSGPADNDTCHVAVYLSKLSKTLIGLEHPQHKRSHRTALQSEHKIHPLGMHRVVL